MDKDDKSYMDRDDKRGIFFGVIGVLTLIVAIIGASLAYFSIGARSEEDALSVQAATVQIVYNDGDQLDVKDIIPSTKAIALETLRRALAGETYNTNLGQGSEQTAVPYQKCIDDKGYTVCGVYEFTLTNNGENEATMTAKIVPSEDDEEEDPVHFTNLKYSLYDITSASGAETGTAVTEEGTVTYEEFKIFPEGNIKIAGNGGEKKYRLFIWLDEQGEANNAEQGAKFKGTIVIDSPEASGNITGTASTVKD